MKSRILSNRRYKTGFLFPDTNFWIGMGSILNIAGDYFTFNTSESGQEADGKALESDWAIIGQDIEDVIDTDKLEKLLDE